MTMMGSQDVPLEDKMVTIVYGIDMVNVQFINFAAISKDVAKVCMVMKLKPWLKAPKTSIRNRFDRKYMYLCFI